MELRQLTYFLTAAQTQNFRKAAELCLVAQPALSRQIAALENELGIALFKRVKQRVVLTPAGRDFAIYARNALDVLQQGQIAMARLQEGQSGTVFIGCNKSLAASFLPSILAEFHQRYPAIHLKIIERTSDEIVALVEQEDVDLGFIFDPATHSEVVMVQELFHQPLHVLVAAHHRLAQTASVTLEQILEEPLYVLGETTRLRKTLERIFMQRNLLLRPAIEIESVEGLKELVRQGRGVTLLTPALVYPAQLHSGLTLLPIQDLTEQLRFALVYRRFGTITLAARQFINAVVDNTAGYKS